MHPDAETAMPVEFARSNVVEVRIEGLVRRTPSLASDGSLDGAPLTKIYVKVYARNAAGAVRFPRTATPTCAAGSTTRWSAPPAVSSDAERTRSCC